MGEGLYRDACRKGDGRMARLSPRDLAMREAQQRDRNALDVEVVRLGQERIDAAAHVQTMRDWIADCTWGGEDQDELDELSDTAIIAGINRHYEGGVRQFLADA